MFGGRFTPGTLALDSGTDTTRLGCGDDAMLDVCVRVALVELCDDNEVPGCCCWLVCILLSGG